MTYEAWRISFQSSEQAARAAYGLLASRNAEIVELVAALDRIINGPWPSDMEGPEDQCRFDRDIATTALAKVRKP